MKLKVNQLELILGGARSGKSTYAEQRAVLSKKELFYFATAEAKDPEMIKRIQKHQKRRGKNWHLVEAPIFLATELQQYAAAEKCILVDCLSMWITNLILTEDQKLFNTERQHLLTTLPKLPGHIILVTTMVSMGVIPLGELNRNFVDQSGLLEQAVAEIAHHVTLVVAGLPVPLKAIDRVESI